jgi:exosortase D (VPLPA-CTERM-specific)
MLAVLLAYFIRSSRWQKLLVVLSAIPVSVVTNGLRIASVGILYQYFGKGVAEGFFHDLSGWFIFMVSFVLLLLELRLLKRLFPSRAAAGDHEDGTLPAAETGAPAVAPSRRFPGIPPQALAVWGVLAVTVIFSGNIDAREKTAMSRPFDRFPLEISGWRGVRTTMETEYINALKFDDYVMADYRDSRGKSVSFYTAYYGSQSKGESVHSPASCLPGSGWVFEESGEVAVPSSGSAGGIRVNRAFIRKGAQQELTYYWFPQRGRNLTTPWQMKLYTFWDAVTRRRTDGALVRIITNVAETEKVTDAEARLQAFTRGVLPVLAEFLPR